MSEEKEDNKSKYPKVPAVNADDIRIFPPVRCDHVNRKQVEVIESALRKGMRRFGVSAASLTWMKSDKMKDKLPEGWKPEVVDLAIDAERRTTKLLEGWMKDKPGVCLIDSMHIPGVGEETIDEETGLLDGGDTDHILVIGSHIYVIDTKDWKKKATYQVNDTGQVIRNRKPFGGGNVNIDKALHMWFDYIDDDDAELVGAIFIDNEDEEDPKTHDWTTKVFRDNNWWKNYWFLLEPSRTIDWLDEQYNQIAGYDPETGQASSLSEVEIIKPSTIAQIAVTCVKPYDRRANLINMKAFNS